MTRSSSLQKNLTRVLFVSFGALASSYVAASGEESADTQLNTPGNPSTKFLVKGVLPKPPTDVTDLKFREFFKMPIGPRGLEPSAKLIDLSDKRVRLIGYMVRQETPTAGFFILAPLPIALGDEDESLSDDLPASTVFVHVDPPAQIVPYHAGLMHLTGTLHLGPHDESDGHVSTIRLQLEPELTQAMLLTNVHAEK